MSLINDALKRAGEVAPPPLSDPGSVPPLLPTVRHRSNPVWPVLMLPAGLLIIFGMAGWFLWHGLEARRHQSSTGLDKVVSARETQPPEPAPAAAPAPPAALPDTEVPPPVPESAPPPPAKENLIITAASQAPPAATFPELKLQGIFWRPSKPSALINTKALFLGEVIDGAQVVAIDRNSATMQWNGQRRVLTLR